MIKIDKLQFSYNSHSVLNSLSLLIEKNHYFALAGLNGAGKTTLIRLIVDLLRSPNKSDIQINGLSSWRVDSRKSLIYLPEKFKLSSNTTALEYFKLLSGVYRQNLDRKKLEFLCGQLDFPVDSLAKRSATYSKGMLQKVGLMGCFILDLPIMLLDEPLSGLDPKARLQVKKLLLEEKKKTSKTLFYSTHMLSDVDELCDSFGILHNGSLKFLGTPMDCLSTYESDTLEQAYMKCIEA